jgi:superfamily II DNA or RNA helicase
MVICGEKPACQGTGKTVIFCTVAKNRNGRTLILAHRDELIQQAVDKLEMVWDGVSAGVVKAERNEIDKQVVVGSVQTVSRENRLEQLPADFDFIVSDEAHHSAAATYQRIYKYLGVMAEGEEFRTDTLHLGVTATPQRTDKIGLSDIFDKIVFHRSINDFIPDYLCDLRCIQIMTHISVDGVSTWAGDLRTEQLSALLNTANCNELIVEAWKEHALGRLTLCFTTDVAHARDLCETFQAHDIKAAWVCGETPLDERRDILAKFAQGEIEVLTNCAVLTEGYDNPALDCIILARPTKSTLLYTQMIGRGTRTYPGKEDCLILDVSCISTKHDLVSFPSLFGLPKKEQDGEQTLTEQLEEKEANTLAFRGVGLRDREVDLFEGRENRRDTYAMSNLAWVQLPKGFRLNLGKDGVINVYTDFRTKTMYRVFYRNKAENRQITRHPVELSWAFGLAESEARRVTSGNLVLVDRGARWRQYPASDKQLAKLAEFGIYRTDLTKGEASDLLGQLFAEQYTI